MSLVQWVARSVVPLVVEWTPLEGLVMFRRPEDAHAVSLTFDDGPDPNHTPALLDVLAKYQVHATFFLCGRPASKHSALIRRIAAEGHVIGNHSYSHVKFSTIPLARVREELAQTDEVIRDAGVQPSNLVRPPWGRLTPLQMARLLRDGRRIVFWSLPSGDHLPDARSIVSRCRMAKPRDILLFHDRNPQTRAALPDILKALADSGLEARPLGAPV